MLFRTRLWNQVARLNHWRSTRVFATFNQIGATRVDDLGIRAHGIANALQNGDWRSGRAIVIAEQRHHVIRSRTNNGDGAELARQRQQLVVLQ